MRIKKFENVDDLSNFGYTDEIENKIREYNSDKNEIVYYVSTIDDKKPHLRSSYTKLEDANDRMIEINKGFPNEYCIFESVTKALTRNDIKRYFDQKKYNL